MPDTHLDAVNTGSAGAAVPQRCQSHDSIATLLGSVSAAALTALPVLDFLAANTQMLSAVRRLLIYYAALVLVTVAVGVVAFVISRHWTRVPLHSWFVAAGVCTLLAFSYHEVRAMVGASDGPSGRALAVLAALMAAGVTLVVSAARTRLAMLVAFLLAAGLMFQPATVIVAAASARERMLQAEQQRFVGAARMRPNIYWIVLDGYPRRDVLREQFGFDDHRFHDGLRQREFVVQDAAVANYPLSITSIAATLSGRYFYTAASAPEEIQNLNPLYPVIRGENSVVARLRSIGYRYVHFANGYDFMTLCSDAPDRCVLGSEQLDEVDVALLSRTPYFDLAPREPTGVEDQPFIRGAISDLTDKLVHIGEVDSPRFVYAHLIVPHPPLRFDATCAVRAEAPDLLGWDAARRPEFVEQVRCAAAQTLDLLDRILQIDADALVIVQSDHGPAFNGQFQTPVAEWSDVQVKERFAVLSALRFPRACADLDVPRNISLVNTFPVVFGCLTATRPQLLPDRSFILVSHDGNAKTSGVVELQAHRMAAH